MGRFLQILLAFLLIAAILFCEIEAKTKRRRPGHGKRGGGGKTLKRHRKKLFEINAGIDNKKLEDEMTKSRPDREGGRPLLSKAELEDMKKNIRLIRKKFAKKHRKAEPTGAPSLLLGDVMLTPVEWRAMAQAVSDSDDETSRTKRDIISQSSDRWPNGIINYVIDGSVSTQIRNLIYDAIQFIESRTCLRFQYGTSSHYLKIVGNQGGCWSYIGYETYFNPYQELNLDDYCNTPSVVQHELAHAIGLFHEQNRRDRDAYIRVLWANIASDWQAQFTRCDQSGLPCTHNYKYDFGSIMHYDTYSTSSNRGKTMEAIDGDYQDTIGQETDLTFLDLKQINQKYCSVATSCSGLTCENQGYVNPSKSISSCSQCICPDQWGGTTCSQRGGLSSCGGTVNAKSTWETISNYQIAEEKGCVWIIDSPPGTQIEYRFESISMWRSVPFGTSYPWQYTCDLQYIELKDRDWDNTGHRFCVVNTQESNFMLTGWTSPSNRVIAIMQDVDADGYSLTGSDFTLEYRYIGEPDADCVWEWGDWGACSATCGPGEQEREVDVITPESGSGTCDQRGQTQTRSCNLGACVDTTTEVVDDTTTEAAEDTTEAAEDTTEAPEDTTEAAEDTTEAPEDTTEAAEDTTTEEGRDCTWEWGEWGECSTTCGAGQREREVEVITDETGSGTCEQRDETETQTCNLGDCGALCNHDGKDNVNPTGRRTYLPGGGFDDSLEDCCQRCKKKNGCVAFGYKKSGWFKGYCKLKKTTNLRETKNRYWYYGVMT